MAGYYVQSGASGTADGSTWANAFTTIALAIAKPIVAGDVLWVSDTHAESTGSAVTWTFPGTLASPNQVLCVNHLGSTPPVSADLRTTGSAATTGNFALTITGAAYFYGTKLLLASGAVSTQMVLGATTQSDLYFDHCLFNLVATNAPSIALGSSTNSIGTRIVWDNTQYQPSSAGALIYPLNGVDFTWKNTSAAIQGTAPTILFGSTSTSSGKIVCDGVDFAGGTGLNAKTFVAAVARNGDYYFKDCVYPATYTINSAPTSAALRISEIRSSNGANAYNLGAHDIRGNQTIETTIIRTGGAQVNGTGVAMKIVGTADALFTAPFVSTPLVVTNTVTGSNVTVTVYGVWAGVAIPNNDQVWMEVGYLGSASNPLLTFDRSTKKADVLAVGAAVATTDASTWGGSTTKFKLQATLSSPQPALAGEMYITIFVASTNATYIDPLPVLS